MALITYPGCLKWEEPLTRGQQTYLLLENPTIKPIYANIFLPKQYAAYFSIAPDELVISPGEEVDIVIERVKDAMEGENVTFTIESAYYKLYDVKRDTGEIIPIGPNGPMSMTTVPSAYPRPSGRIKTTDYRRPEVQSIGLTLGNEVDVDNLPSDLDLSNLMVSEAKSDGTSSGVPFLVMDKVPSQDGPSIITPSNSFGPPEMKLGSIILSENMKNKFKVKMMVESVYSSGDAIWLSLVTRVNDGGMGYDKVMLGLTTDQEEVYISAPVQGSMPRGSPTLEISDSLSTSGISKITLKLYSVGWVHPPIEGLVLKLNLDDCCLVAESGERFEGRDWVGEGYADRILSFELRGEYSWAEAEAMARKFGKGA